ncbi:MAG: asparaginase [Rhizomicrobium sp.]
MSNPILVEITRGSLIESVHRGSLAIADADGVIRFARGDVQSLTAPRSALKPVQALPLIETGAAEHFSVSDEEVALACSSHSGEAMHISRIAAWLKRIGCSEADLACGPHAPFDENIRIGMALRGEVPTSLHNNCSGKHAGFLTVAQHLGAGPVSYIHADHAVQKEVAATVRRLSGVENLPYVVDGCAAPNFCLSLTGFSRALARMAGGKTKGAVRIFSAMTTFPELVAGTGRSCTALMRACHGRAAVKSGAEGVYAAFIPESGLGVALKIDDGTGRASETVMAAVLAGLGVAGPDIQPFVRAPILNTRGIEVGERRPAAAISKADLSAI